jgi:hypothetical protein
VPNIIKTPMPAMATIADEMIASRRVKPDVDAITRQIPATAASILVPIRATIKDLPSGRPRPKDIGLLGVPTARKALYAKELADSRD